MRAKDPRAVVQHWLNYATTARVDIYNVPWGLFLSFRWNFVFFGARVRFFGIGIPSLKECGDGSLSEGRRLGVSVVFT